jgi:hypothetical protein
LLASRTRKENPNIEIRNSKQIQMTKQENPKHTTRGSGDRDFGIRLVLDFLFG